MTNALQMQWRHCAACFRGYGGRDIRTAISPSPAFDVRAAMPTWNPTMDSSSGRLSDRMTNRRSVIPACNRSANAIRHFHFIDPTSRQTAGRYRPDLVHSSGVYCGHCAFSVGSRVIVTWHTYCLRTMFCCIEALSTVFVNGTTSPLLFAEIAQSRTAMSRYAARKFIGFTTKRHESSGAETNQRNQEKLGNI